MFTMRRTVAEGVRMCTGFAAPSSIGPTVMPSPEAVFKKVECDVGGVEIRHHQEIRLPFEAGARVHTIADLLRERRVAVHLAVDLEARRELADLGPAPFSS